MQAGKYDRKVQFQSRIVTEGAFGNSEAWLNVGGTRWAEVKQMNVSEASGGGQVQATIATRFVVRKDSFTDAITPVDRIVFGGMTYEITGKREIYGERRRELEFSGSARNDLD